LNKNSIFVYISNLHQTCYTVCQHFSFSNYSESISFKY